uniref:Uncharacterized protein n=1 Tax=Arundo donax TaxID=35708 RepID=A0A0A9DEJ3_ARUDO
MDQICHQHGKSLKDLGYSYCDANKKVQQENVALVGILPHPQTSSMILHLKEPSKKKVGTKQIGKIDRPRIPWRNIDRKAGQVIRLEEPFYHW